MIDVTTFSRLVSMIYDAAIRPGLWGPTVEEIHRAFGATGGGLVFAGPGDRIIRVSNVDPESTQSYNTHYWRLDYVIAAVEAGGVGDVRTGAELLDPNKNSEFHTDWVRGTGTEDGLFVRLTPGRDPATLALISPRRPTPYGSAEHLEYLRLLVPHLQRAIATQRTLARTAEQELEVSAMLETMNHGALIVDRECSVIKLNCTAEAMVRTRDGLAITAGGRMVTTTVAGDNSLSHAVRRAFPDAVPLPACGATLLCRRPSGRRSYVVHVVPLGSSDWADLSTKRTALMIIVDPESLPGSPSAILRRLYGLTTTEADIAVRVTRADDLKTIAADLGVSITTVRTHLQHIFTKTDTHRQAELVRFLSTIAR
jgi:DNA-binding CsgD family transcriptional regulator